MMIADASNSDTHIAITAVMILKLMITKIAAAMEIADRIRVVIVTAEIPVSAPKPRSEPRYHFHFSFAIPPFSLLWFHYSMPLFSELLFLH